jgi:hypothetical protein
MVLYTIALYGVKGHYSKWSGSEHNSGSSCFPGNSMMLIRIVQGHGFEYVSVGAANNQGPSADSVVINLFD